MTQSTSFKCNDLDQTQEAGRQIASLLSFPACVYLQGDLGAGKTSLCKAIIDAFGYQGVVTSPTYNLVQEYAVEQGIIYHMDLYRLEDSSELEFLALDDLWDSKSLFLVEWPERGGDYLRSATHTINIRQSASLAIESRFISMIKNC